MRPILRVLPVVVLVVTLGGCDRAAEELAERAAEQVTGADIEMDDEGGEFTIETDDGTFETGTGRLPEGFPGAIPLADGGELINGSRLEGEDGTAWQVNWQYEDGNPFDVLAAQVALLEDAGFVATEDGTFTMGDGSEGMGGTMVENGEFQVNITVLGEQDDFILGYQVFEQDDEG